MRHGHTRSQCLGCRGNPERSDASEINASISWLWDGDIDVKLGDPLNVYVAEGKVRTFAEAATWLRDQACTHYPDSEFAREYGGFV
jgi:hypothetical protein